MAEFPSAGKHCQEGDCRVLDYLPFYCLHCQKIYCTAHRYDHCCFHKSAISGGLTPPEAYKSNVYAVCSAAGCFKTGYAEIRCSNCKLNFCHSHRNGEDHGCFPRRTAASSTPQLPVIHNSNSIGNIKYEPVQGTGTNFERMKKIMLMKMRNRMRELNGNQSHSAFFVRLPNGDVYPVVVAKIWTLSHALSTILEQCNLDTTNHELIVLTHNGAELDLAQPLGAIILEEHMVLDLAYEN